jgi:hypothetical protein
VKPRSTSVRGALSDQRRDGPSPRVPRIRPDSLSAAFDLGDVLVGELQAHGGDDVVDLAIATAR